MKLSWGVFLICLAACSGTNEVERDAGAPDARTNVDSGASSDAGVVPDTGVATDTGVTADTGVTPDSGTPNDAGPPLAMVPRAVRVAQATTLPACTVFVDVANNGMADGTAARPYQTIAAAITAASNGAIICVAEGTYPEALAPAEKYFTLAGGFQAGQNFTVRDSSLYVTRGQGNGSNSFFRVEDPGPTDGQLTVIDGFELTGYAQAIYRDFYVSQRFDITNNYIHDNTCTRPDTAGGGFALNNVSGTISGNVIARNSCSRGGAGFINDATNMNSVTITRNLIEANEGTEPDISHGGALYLFANNLTLTGNEFTRNTATGWGGGLFVGAFTGGGQFTTATLSWNLYRDNRAGGAGGGFFCDDSATCFSDHEIYDSNCGGNVYLDSGPDNSEPTRATFDHMTNYRALEVGCGAPGAGVVITKNNTARDSYSFTNSIFWGNQVDRDFDASCGSGCGDVTVSVTYSNVQTRYANGGVTISFGAGNLAPVDPLFVDADAGDFHLRSTFGHWTPAGYVTDAADSPALARGQDGSELGAYGNSPEASYVR